MDFLYPISMWISVPLVAVPIAIHLINLRRQQRIRWAAMQFLIESQRRNRRWILLKQLLLLMTRMAVIALLLMLLAHLVLKNQWLSLLGNGTTHHLVLLDDSFSMSDKWDDTSALGEGKKAIQAIIDEAYRQSDRHLITLLRFSEAASLTAGAQPKVFATTINEPFISRLESLLAGWDTSQTDVGPAVALKAVRRLPIADTGQSLIVYVISDFRARQFDAATETRELLADLNEDENIGQIHLIRCVREARPNLAITSLTPESGVRAAGVEMWMSVTVANYADTAASGVTVQLEQDGDALPALVLDDIAPRDKVTHKFRVQFSGTGAHTLTASLAADAVALDNQRYFACDLPDAKPVLVIDGSPDGRGARELSLALAPGGNTRTGWRPHTETTRFLADTERLQQQAAVCLLDIPRLADDEISALESYVRSGGGVAFFVGAEIDRAFYNEHLHENRNGLFPVPLKLPTQLLDARGDDIPDLEIGQHPLFQVLSGRRNGFLPLMMIDYFYAVDDAWSPPEDGSVRVLASLRNKQPLVLEKQFGKGRVIAHLTKLSSGDTRLGRWSNWSVNPAFPVLANELISYLAAGRQDDPLLGVGSDLIVSVDESKYEPTFRFSLPGDERSTGSPRRRAEVLVDATPKKGTLIASLEDVSASGIYDVQLQPLAGGAERRVAAVNVVAAEGDLRIADRATLIRQLAGVDFQLHDAGDMMLNAQQLAGFPMTDALLAGLVALLLVEQLLGYFASYHVAPKRENVR